MVFRLGMIGLVVAIALWAPASAAACSCAGPSPGEERQFYAASIKRSDLTIIGKAVSTRREPGAREDEGFFGDGKNYTTFRIVRPFKRKRRFPRGELIEVFTGSDGSSCAIFPEIGSKSGLFLLRSGGEWGAGSCSLVGKRDLRRAARFLRKKRNAKAASSLGKPDCRQGSGGASSNQVLTS